MSQRGMRRLEEELKKVGGQRENDVIEGLVAKLKAAAAGKKDKDVGASLCGAEVVGGEAVGGEVLRAGRLGRGVAGGGGRHKENGIESRERELIYMRSDAEAGARHGRRPHLAASVAFLPSARSLSFQKRLSAAPTQKAKCRAMTLLEASWRYGIGLPCGCSQTPHRPWMGCRTAKGGLADIAADLHSCDAGDADARLHPVPISCCRIKVGM